MLYIGREIDRERVSLCMSGAIVVLTTEAKSPVCLIHSIHRVL